MTMERQLIEKLRIYQVLVSNSERTSPFAAVKAYKIIFHSGAGPSVVPEKVA